MPRSRAGWGVPRNTPNWRSRSWRTRCSTVSASDWTLGSGSPRSRSGLLVAAHYRGAGPRDELDSLVTGDRSDHLVCRAHAFAHDPRRPVGEVVERLGNRLRNGGRIVCRLVDRTDLASAVFEATQRGRVGLAQDEAEYIAALVWAFGPHA